MGDLSRFRWRKEVFFARGMAARTSQESEEPLKPKPKPRAVRGALAQFFRSSPGLSSKRLSRSCPVATSVTKSVMEPLSMKMKGAIEHVVVGRDKFFVDGRGPRGKVALTFDDGPDPETTHTLLSFLRRENVSAAFFLVGVKAMREPSLVRHIMAEGHIMGTHTWSHRRLEKRLSRKEMQEEMRKAETLFMETTGSRTYIMRPPFGTLAKRTMALLKEMNYVVVRWATAVREAAKEKVVDETLWHRLKAYGGGVLLLHERPTMVSAVPELIRGLRERGYDIVPLTYFFSDEVRDFLWDAYDCQLENRPPLLSHTCLLLHNPSAPLPRNTEVQRILISLPPLVRQPTTQKKEVPAMTSSSLYESKFPPGTDPSPSMATWVWVAGALLCLLGITIGFLFWRARQSTLQRKIV